MNVRNVVNASTRSQPSQYISELIQGKNPLNVINVVKTFTINQTSLNIKENTQERNPMNAQSVVNHSLWIQSSDYIKGLIQERNPMNARNVGNPFLRSHILPYIRESTQGRNPMSVRSVGTPLSRSHNSMHIRRHIHGREKLTNSMSWEFLSEFILQCYQIIYTRETSWVSSMRGKFQPQSLLIEYQQMHGEKFYKFIREKFLPPSRLLNIRQYRWQNSTNYKIWRKIFLSEVVFYFTSSHKRNPISK